MFSSTKRDRMYYWIGVCKVNVRAIFFCCNYF